MKVAAVQMDVKILAREHNLDHILHRLEQAAGAGAKLAVFPECALSGYCFVSSEEAAPVAEEVPGPSTEKILAAAQSARLHGRGGVAGARGRPDLQLRRGGHAARHSGNLSQAAPALPRHRLARGAGRQAFSRFRHAARQDRHQHLLRLQLSGKRPHAEVERRADSRHSHQLATGLRYLAAHAAGAGDGESYVRHRLRPRGRGARIPFCRPFTDCGLQRDTNWQKPARRRKPFSTPKSTPPRRTRTAWCGSRVSGNLTASPPAGRKCTRRLRIPPDGRRWETAGNSLPPKDPGYTLHMRNRFFLWLYSYVNPLQLDLHKLPPDLPATDLRYFLGILQNLDQLLPGAGVTFVLTWHLDSYDEIMKDAVILLVGDEQFQTPSYRRHVRAIFKTGGIRPNPLSETLRLPWSIAWRALLRDARNKLTGIERWLQHGTPGKAPAVRGVLPLGYFQLRDIGPVPVSQRPVDVFFAGVQAVSGWTLRASVAARKQMAAGLKAAEAVLPQYRIESLLAAFTSGRRLSPEDYTQALANAKIALAPRGNFDETFRLFEAASWAASSSATRCPTDGITRTARSS